MVRKLALFLGVSAVVLLFASRPAQAQDRGEVYAGYSYMRFNPGNGTDGNNLNGFDISGQYKFAPWIGAVADFGGEYGTVAGVSGSSVNTFLFGPQVSFPARVSPFAHVLIGAGHFDFGHGGPSDTAFASALGFGFDARLRHGVAWRVVQADWVHTSFFGDGQNNARISTGIVLRF